MTHTKYSHQQLRSKSLAQLKRIYSEIGCTVEVNDRRCKDSWRSAIARYQESKLQKVDEQDIAQGEFDQYIADQANAIAPEELTVREISFYEYEIYCGTELIATISYDHTNFVTQRWIVIVNGVELFRRSWWQKCFDDIRWHYKRGSLPVQEEAGGQGGACAGEENSSHLTVASSTGNEIMVQLFDACEQYGLELLEDGIYQNDVKLGQAGCTHNNSQLSSRNSQLNTVPKSQKPCTCNDSINNSLHNCELRIANCSGGSQAQHKPIKRKSFVILPRMPSGYCNSRMVYPQLTNTCNIIRWSNCLLVNCGGYLRLRR